MSAAGQPALGRPQPWEERALAVSAITASLSLAYALGQPVLAGVGALCLILFPLLRRAGPATSARAEGTALVVAGALGTVLGVAAGEPAPALGLFLLTAQGAKLLRPRTERDRGTSSLIGVVLVAVAAAEAVEPPVALLLLTSASSTLIYAALRSTRLQGQAGSSDGAPRVVGSMGRGAVASYARLAVVGALGTTAFFFACPRVGAKLLASPRDSRDRLAGFTDRVGMADIGRIKQNDRLAFRVEVGPGVLEEAPYWRGRALDEYDGKTWMASPFFGLTKRGLDRDGPLVYSDVRVHAPRGVEPVELSFYIEPLGTRCLFTLGNTQQITFRTAGPRGGLTRDDMQTIQTLSASQRPLAYTLRTFLDDAGSRVLLSEARQRRAREYCLRLPEGVIDVARLESYARRALRDQRIPPDAPPSRVAEALAAHLTRNHSYTLDIEQESGREPVTDFLYRTRRGHCELFASAHALLLRSQGIPTRLVTGFRGGEYSGWTGAFIVRQRDAHAWVEAFTEGGWQRFDPTPAEARREGPAPLWERLVSFADWLELRWFSLVIAFDAYDQRNFLYRAREWLAVRMGMPEQPERVLPILGGAAATLALGLLGFAAGLVWLRRARAARAERGALSPRDPGLEALLRALEASGLRRGHGETPLELARRASEALALDSGLVDWVRAYYAARFGAAPPPAAERLAAVLAALAPQEGDPDASAGVRMTPQPQRRDVS